MKKQTGFTLIELMIVVTLLGLTLVLGVPSFKNSMARNQIAVQSHAFVAAVMMARTEAVKRSETINVIAIAPVDNNEWGGGWKIERAANQEVLSVHNVSPNVSVNSSDGYQQYQFNSRGMLSGNFTDTLVVCHKTVSIAGRKIQIGTTGRVVLSPGSC